MRTILFASALSLLALGPAAAQSCVSNGMFVPCGGGGMAPGMMQPGMAQPGMAAQPGMQQGAMMEEQKPMRRAKRKRTARR